MPKRNVWYNVKFTTLGPVIGNVEAMARAVIVHHGGTAGCYASAPDASYLKGHAYAVHLRPYNSALQEVYDILQEQPDGTYIYVATAFVKDRFRQASPPEDYIQADAIIFDNRVTAEPSFYPEKAA